MGWWRWWSWQLNSETCANQFLHLVPTRILARVLWWQLNLQPNFCYHNTNHLLGKIHWRNSSHNHSGWMNHESDSFAITDSGAFCNECGTSATRMSRIKGHKMRHHHNVRTCWNAVLILPCCSNLPMCSCAWCGSDAVGTGVAAPERNANSKCSVNVVCWLCRAVVTSRWTTCRNWSISKSWCLHTATPADCKLTHHSEQWMAH